MSESKAHPAGNDRQDALTVSVIQFNGSDEDKQENVDKALRYLDVAGQRGSKLAVLPETFTGTGLSREDRARELAEPIPGPTTEALQEKARHYGMTVVGSLFERGEDGRTHNTAPVIGPDGALLGSYRKSHLFDPENRPDIPDVRESRKVAPGDALLHLDIDGVRYGIAVCSDLRFPEIFLEYALRDVEVVVLPTAFLAPRGDHWEFLMRARATDNQYFMVGTGMVGKLANTGIGFVGRSMVVDPWGVILAQSPDYECCTTSMIDLSAVRTVRQWWPLNRQRRPWMYTSTTNSG